MTIATPDKTRRPYAAMRPVAQALAARLAGVCERVEIAGSIRRCKETIGDIEIVAIPQPLQAGLFAGSSEGPTAVDQLLQTWPITFLRNGPRLKSFHFTGNSGQVYKVDLFLVLDSLGWGPILAIRTGSSDFSHWLVSQRSQGGACPPGFRFIDGHLTFNNRMLETPEEADVFGYLSLDWTAPEDRHQGWWGRYTA